MRKVLLTILIGSMGFISGYASNTIRMEEKGTTVQEVNTVEMMTLPRPPISYWYNPKLSTVSIYVPPYHDSVFAVLQNITTGKSWYCPVESVVTEFPITREDGLWRISVGRGPRTHNPAILYERYFIIDNGEVINVEPSFKDIIGF